MKQKLLSKKILNLSIIVFLIFSIFPSTAQNTLNFSGLSHSQGDDIGNPYSVVSATETFVFTSTPANPAQTAKHFFYNMGNPSPGNCTIPNVDFIDTGSGAVTVSDWSIKTNSGNEMNLNSITFVNPFFCTTAGSYAYPIVIQARKNGSNVGTSVPITLDALLKLVDLSSNTDFDDIDEIVVTSNSGFDLISVGIQLIEWESNAPSNTDPTISIDNSTLAYIEGNTAMQIDAAGTVNDDDGDADWNGGTLVAQITANAEATDEISISDTDGDAMAITVSGTNILSNGTSIGTLNTSGGTVTNGTALTITFDSDATNTIVQEVLQSLRYRNTSTTPGTSNRTITITANDTNGGSANDTRTVSVSTVAPAIPIVTTPSTTITVNAATQTISGTHSENGVTVHAYADINNDGTADNTTSLGSATVIGNTWSFSVSLNQDNINDFVVSATDGIDTSNNTDVPTITEDSTNPADPVVTTPSAATTINAATQTIAGTHTENGVTVHAYVDANDDGIADNSISLGSATVSGNTWSFSVNLTQDNTNNFVVQAEDNAGNISNDIDVPTITEDSTAPADPVVTTPGSTITVNAATQTIAGTHTENGVTVHAYVDANNDGVADNTTSLGSATVTANAWSFSVNLTQDNTNNFVVQAEDNAGNISNDVDVPTITEDSTAPADPVVTTPGSAITVNAATQTIAGTHTENGVTVHAYADANNDGVADNTTSLGSATVTANAWSFSVNLTQDNTNNFVVQAEDNAGNISNDIDVPTITEDSTAPADPVVTTPGSAITVNAATQTIAGTHTENGVTVHAYVDANNDGVADNTTSLGSATVTANAWSLSLNLTQDNTNNFVVQAEDNAGNISNDVDVPTITEDSTTPADPVVTTPGSTITVNAATQTIAGTHTENGVTVHAYADANNDGVADNTTSLGSATVTANAWSFSVNLTQDNTNNFVVQAEDNAGNTSNDVDVPTITEDSTAPADPVITLPTTPVSVNFLNGFISGTHSENGVTIHIYLDTDNDGQPDLPLTSLDSDVVDMGSWTVNGTLTANAEFNFVVRAEDAAGNTSNYVNVPTVIQDSIAPVAPVVTTPAMAVTINTATYTLEGTHTEDDVTIHAYIDADNDGVADDNVSLGSADVSGGDWSFNVNITANTVHNFVIQAVDDAGNTSNEVDVPTITHDSTLSTDSITFNKKAMRVYPNPSNGIIQYSYNGNATINTIEVYNLQGKQILKQKATTTIDISTVANGIYFVKFNANEGSLIKRVVKN